MNQALTETTATACAASELIDLTTRLGRIARRFARAHLDDFGLTLPLYRTLRIARRRPRRMSELTDVLMLSKQAVSQTVDALVKSGLLTRTEDPQDRRHTLVAATPEGERRIEAFDAAFARYMADMLAVMPADEQAELAEALANLNTLLVQRRDSGYFRSSRGSSATTSGQDLT